MVVGVRDNQLVLYDIRADRSKVLAEQKIFAWWYWSADSRSLFVVDTWDWGSRRSVYSINIESGEVGKVWQVGMEIGAWGSAGRWIGVTPAGKIVMLRNQSIHNIYALHWNPD